MPCYSNQEEASRTVYEYRNGVDPRPYESAISNLKDRGKWLEGALCAIITELESRNISSEIISDASKNGMLDIAKFWNEHKGDDISRLMNDISKFSEHEKEIIKNLLNKNI
jgi:hypothetical protein